MEFNKIVVSKNVQTRMFVFIDDKDGWSESFKAEVLIPFKTVAAIKPNENSTTTWQHLQPRCLLRFCKMERWRTLHCRCEIMVKAFLMSVLSLFTLSVNRV